MNTSEWDRNGEKRSKLRIKNVYFFVVERVCLLIQMKSILFYELFLFFSFLFFSLHLK